MSEEPEQFAVVIPAYNEAATIRGVAARALSQIATVIVVDDGSTDGTTHALENLPVILLRNSENCGKAASLWLGSQEAVRRGARFIVTLDGDGQHSPEDIPKLVSAHASAGESIIIGSRLHAKAEIPPLRYWANRTANFWISWAAGCPIEDTQSGFRIYPCRLITKTNLRHDHAHSFVFESEILIEAQRLAVGIVCVPVNVSYTQLPRRSHFRPVMDIARIVRMVGGKLLTRGLNPGGLLRIVQHRLRRKRVVAATAK
jgi:glycosyltransferase involved in cell wall biosynthesis